MKNESVASVCVMVVVMSTLLLNTMCTEEQSPVTVVQCSTV